MPWIMDEDVYDYVVEFPHKGRHTIASLLMDYVDMDDNIIPTFALEVDCYYDYIALEAETVEEALYEADYWIKLIYAESLLEKMVQLQQLIDNRKARRKPGFSLWVR